MGCRQGKVDDDKTRPGSLDPIPDPSAPAATDPRLPLNAREVFRLQKSWKAIKRNMEQTGIEMFIRFFKDNLELLAMFGEFRDVSDPENLRNNDALELHAGLVMGIVDDIISHIEQVDYVLAVCHKVSSTHARMPSFSSPLFWKIEVPLRHALKIVLGDRYTDSMADIYSTTVKFILKSIVDEHVKLSSTKLQDSSQSEIDTKSKNEPNGNLDTSHT